MAVKEKMDWYSLVERVAAGVVTGVITGVVLFYTFPAVVTYLQQREQLSLSYLRPADDSDVVRYG